MAYLSPFLTKLLWKIAFIYCAKFTKTGWRCKVAVSLIIFLHELRIQKFSYKYNSPAGRAQSNSNPTQQKHNSKKVLLRNIITSRTFSMHTSNQAHSYMNTPFKRFHNKIHSIEQKIPVYREIIGSEFIKSQNMLMTLCH